MCLLIAAQKSFPSLEILKLGEEQNAHGGGIAWTENDMVHWKKGIKYTEMLEYESKGPPWLIHFRYQTFGGERADLCHPFPITRKASTNTSGSAKMVLGHNGTWRDWSREVLLTADHEIKVPDGPWSDTRAIAWLASIRGDEFLTKIHEKVAVLTPKGFQIYHKHAWHDLGNGTFLSYNPMTRIKKGNGGSATVIANKSNNIVTKPKNTSEELQPIHFSGTNSLQGNYLPAQPYTQIELPSVEDLQDQLEVVKSETQN